MDKKRFEEITNWQRETFPTMTVLSSIIHLQEEVQELKTDAIMKNSTIGLEFADCFILLFGAAAANGMTYEDIVSCVDEKFKINKQRKWSRPNKDGVVNHIE